MSNANLVNPFTWACIRAARTIIPEPKDRIPLTISTAIYPLLAFVPFTFMAYLVRRPDTYLARLLLLPLVITTALRGAFAYFWTDPRLNVYNWGGALASFVMIAKAIDWALVPEGRFKLGERQPGAMEEPAVAAKEAVPDAPGDASARRRPLGDWLPRGLEDALEVIFSLRGLGWDYGKDVYVPKQTRPIERSAYLRATLTSFLCNFLALDLIEATLKLVPGVGDVHGGTIFLPNLPPPQRYAVSTLIHFSTGCALLAGFGMVYDLCTLLAVGLLHHLPTSWPPVLDNPWVAQSLHEFWSRRWHQLLRQTFLVFGGWPGAAIAGDVGLVIGTFFASGMFHECTMYAMGREWDWRVPLFFVLQGFSVIGERVWRIVTGRRVDGWLGTLWVYIDIVVFGQPLVDSWHRRGLAGGMVIPPPISPARQLLFPTIRRLLHI
ncbi:hypothetical protein K488DRAFT_79290 [Vararia minispora EC-137]|uniref:Uncharacterized protein n=1 Tax=Vararia minispora EC-137 TaxID=1314806 RepID=A0ACB8QHF6_9AGAM|nr:hypothetical protein K488DRAFT_79290 [Vararia minispora EC-137]